jgi:hypothetical protein
MRYRRKRRGRDGGEDSVEINITRWFVTLLIGSAVVYIVGPPAFPFAVRILGI